MEKNNIKFDIDRENDYSHIDSDIKIEYGKDENKDIYYSNISRTIITIGNKSENAELLGALRLY